MGGWAKGEKVLEGEVVTHDKNATDPRDCTARGPIGKIHENPFSGGVHEQVSELRSKWEARKLYPPRGTQGHLFVGKTSPHAHPMPLEPGLSSSGKLAPTPLPL